MNFNKTLKKMLRFQRKKGIVGACVLNSVYLHDQFPGESEICAGVVIKSDREHGGHIWLHRNGKVVECSHEWDEPGVALVDAQTAARLLDWDEDTHQRVVRQIQGLADRAQRLRNLSWETYKAKAIQSSNRTLARREYAKPRMAVIESESSTYEEKQKAAREIREYVEREMNA
jgi:hypothetical protein